MRPESEKLSLSVRENHILILSCASVQSHRKCVLLFYTKTFVTNSYLFRDIMCKVLMTITICLPIAHLRC